MKYIKPFGPEEKSSKPIKCKTVTLSDFTNKDNLNRSQIRFLNIRFDLSVSDTFVLALGFILKHTAVLASDLHCASVRHVKRGSADGDANMHLLFRWHIYSARQSFGFSSVSSRL